MPAAAATERLSALGITVFERGWLSSNNILLLGDGDATVIDTGYVTHADLTVELLRQALGDRPLARILNTHLHSDHCGGNAALQMAWPHARTAIPPGLAGAVRVWDNVALTHEPTGQQCPRFTANALLIPGESLFIGGLRWNVLSADGHDPHAVILHQPDHRILISADALWGNGFGVVFPELEGESGFTEVRNTLQLIDSLAPDIVIPGHGAVFAGPAVPEAMHRARTRLMQFESDPKRHRQHALKVLIKFKLLEWQRCHQDTLTDWFLRSSYFLRIVRKDTPAPLDEVLNDLLQDLMRGGALRRDGEFIYNG
ncbi:MAG: MBL fold metallo-hydrolase [Hydrogenophaga sp.]|nr:MBL fold metallo-hydrolase [Hydrogenophaga sp.]